MNRSSALLVAALLLGAPAQALSAPVQLTSHRATYPLSLATGGERGSNVQAVQGGLVIEWRASCEGWISTQRLNFAAQTDEGPGFSYDIRFSSVESRDDRSLRFSIRTTENGGASQDYRGRATLSATGGEGAVVFEQPDGQTMTLPPGTVFPTQHLRAVIEAAEAGQSFVARDVFDGAGLEGLSQVTAVIGKAQAGTDGKESWPVSLAYHRGTDEDPLPAFELTFAIDRGGVLHRVRLDYGDFQLEGRLEKLETLPVASCD